MTREEWSRHRRRRFRRHGRIAYIRSFYSLPSLATLGNAVCGFGAIYVSGLTGPLSPDGITEYLAGHRFTMAAYLIFLAMFFDALDGRLARFTRHTTDFGGQLDSLADVISFGAAPAFLALQLFRSYDFDLPIVLSRLIWASGALYMSCAAIRLARFNVSNEHGEQHHFSFLGLPSPGAGGTVAAFVLMQQELARNASSHRLLAALAEWSLWLLPLLVLLTGLLMVSSIRYPHLVNRFLRGRRTLPQLLVMLAIALAVIAAHRYAVALGTLIYAMWGPVALLWSRMRPARPTSVPGLEQAKIASVDEGAG